MSRKRVEQELVAVEGFCGAGGMSLGLRRAGFRVGAAFDLNEPAIKTYQANLGNAGFVANVVDVTAADLLDKSGVKSGGIALVAGGPPCQGFSVQRRQGKDDPRNSLPVAFLELIKSINPPFFIFENVPGIRNRHGQAILEAFIREATASGYHCHVDTLDAVRFGVPQSRRRLFVVGEATADGSVWFRFPTPTTSADSENVTVGAALTGLPSPPSDYSAHPTIPNHRRIRLSPLNERRLAHVPQGGGMEDLPVDLRVACHKNGADRIGHRYVYGRLHWKEPSATITARFDSFTRGKFGHPLENRNISLREGARLQTFPDDFKFFGSQEEIAAQIGNAVPPYLAEALGRSVADAIGRRMNGTPPADKPTPQQLPLFARS